MSIHPIGTTDPMRTSPFAQSAAAENFASAPAHDNTRAQAGGQGAQGQPGGGDGEANRLGNNLAGQSSGSSSRQGGGGGSPQSQQTNDWRNALLRLDQQVGRLDSAATGKPLPASQHAAFRRPDAAGRNALSQSAANQAGLGLSGSGLSGSSGTDRFERTTSLLHDTSPDRLSPPAKDAAPLPVSSISGPLSQPAKDAALGAAAGLGAGLSQDLRSFSDRQPLLHDWGKNTAMWTMREAFSDVVDRATASHKPIEQTSKVDPRLERLNRARLAANADAVQMASDTKSSVIKDFGYTHWLKLGRETVQLKDMNWVDFRKAVSSNIASYKPSSVSGTLREIGTITPNKLKLFFKKTLIGNNVRPVTKMFDKNVQDKQIGSGIFRVAIYGYMLYEAVKHTRDTYEAYKAKEDGTTSSKMRTWGHTALAFLKYSARALIGWEAGSVGFVIGRALLPMALGPLCIPGLIIGGLVGAGAQLVFDNVMGTNRKDPNQDFSEKKSQSHTPNPFIDRNQQKPVSV